MLLALALGPGTSWLNHQDTRWAQAISAALHTAAPQTAQDRFGLRVRIVTLALALAWLLTVPIVQRAQWAMSPRHT